MTKEYRPRKVERIIKGRRIAIGDIHGCYFAFKSLLEKLKITKADQIFLLGDIIDKGKNSGLVLDLILKLKSEGLDIFIIRGNHEEQLLIAFNCGFDFFEKYLINYNSQDLLCEDLDEYLDLIYNSEYCIELDNFILSHAGINEKRINPYTDLRGMFPNIRFQFEESKYLEKIQIHGHFVRTIHDISESVKNNERRFSIDSGCYLNEEKEFGYLTAIDLDSMELFHEKEKLTDNLP